MKKLLITIILLLFAVTLPACRTPTTETPSPAESTEIPPTKAPPPIDTPVPTPVCDPQVYNEPEKLGTTTGNAPVWFVGSADVTGDGYTDVILSRLDFGTANLFEIEIWRNDGEGGFVLATPDLFEGAIPTTQHPREFVFADFNGDGVTDIFIADHGQDADPFPGYQNTLVLSVPGGKLIDATDHLPQQYDFTHSAAAGDIDSDGDMDLFIGNYGNHYPPQIWVNDGEGSFTNVDGLLPEEIIKNIAKLVWSIDPSLVRRYSSGAFVDVNNDNFPDLILGGMDYSASETTAVTVIESLDLNGDNYQDLLVAITMDARSWIGAYVQVLINNGDGTFHDETSSRFTQVEDDTGQFPMAMDLYDIDYDGDVDMILKRGAPPSPEVRPFYLNDGAGVFSQAATDHNLNDYNLFTILDAYGDGYLDIVMAVCPRYWCSNYDIYIIHDIGCKEEQK